MSKSLISIKRKEITHMSSNSKKATAPVQTSLILGVEEVIVEKIETPVVKHVGPYTNHGADKLAGMDVYRIGDMSIFNDETGVRKPFICIALSTNPSTESANMAQKAARSLTVASPTKRNSTYATSANLIVNGTTDSDMPFIREHIANNGRVLVCLPMGRSVYKYTDEIKGFITNGKMVIVSVAGQYDKWTLEYSQLRNELISKLAMTFFSPECKGDKGVYDLASRFSETGKEIYIPKVSKDTPHTHDAMIRRLGAVQLATEKTGVAHESVNIYTKIFLS
jgi:hypothetical protein